MNFDKLEKITDFKMIAFLPRDRYKDEPQNGTITYNSRLYYFVFNSEFDDGNNYTVYDSKNKPIFRFSLHNDPDGDINGPMLTYLK